MSIDAFTERKGKARKASPGGSRKRATDELIELRKAGRMAEARGRHFAAFYCDLHEGVYGVEPKELEGPEWFAFVNAAERTLEREFNGNALAMVELLRWTWQREKRKTARVKAEGGELRRLVWRWQFSASTLTDYRAAVQR